MKKFLSLVLALVMTMSLVVVGASAKTFTDSSKINYKDAVDVVSACKIIDGYTDGSFNPTGTLTRGAAAKIICNMILGPTTAAALGADAAPFKDVPANHTFAGYIAYCAQQGIINGFADGTFRPAATVTGYQFMKMLLGALGYDGKIEGFTGDNWSVNVAKIALNISLDDGNDNFVGSKAMTREEACLYAFNTLKATMVEYDSTTNIVVGGTNISVGNTKAKDMANTASKETYKDDNLMQFCEKYFDKLTAKTTTDDFGPPLPSGAMTAILSAPMPMTPTRPRSLSRVLPRGAVIETFEDDDNKVATIVILEYVAAKIDSVDKDLSSTYTKKGASVEIDLTEVNSSTSMGTYYDNHDDSEKVLNGYDASTYVKDAVLAIAIRQSDDTVLDSYVATKVSGEATAYKTDDYVTVNGTKQSFAGVKGSIPSYVDGMTDNFDLNSTTYTVYTTAAGYVLAVDKNAGSISDVYYVVGLYQETSTLGTVKYYAQVVSLKGVVSTIRLEPDCFKAIVAKDSTGKYGVIGSDGTVSYTDTVFADSKMYAVNSAYVLSSFTDDDEKLFGTGKQYAASTTVEDNNDKLTAEGFTDSDYDYAVSALTAEVAKDDTSVKYTSVTSYNGTTYAKNYITDSTQFISVEDHGDDISVATATGMMKMGNATKVVTIFEDGEKDASYVIYFGDTLSGASGDIVYLDDKASTTVTSGYSGPVTYFMDGMTSQDGLTFKSQYTQGFWKVDSTDTKNNVVVYTLTSASASKLSNTYNDSKDGYLSSVTIGKKDYNKNTLTIDDATYSGYEDISFANAKIIDTRGSGDKDAALYGSDITTASKLQAALDKGYVTADLYFEDGDITFIAVTETANEETYTIGAPEITAVAGYSVTPAGSVDVSTSNGSQTYTITVAKGAEGKTVAVTATNATLSGDISFTVTKNDTAAQTFTFKAVATADKATLTISIT
jgi:hypothetical protein